MNVIFRIIACIIGYCFGLIQSGYIIGKLYKIDIREHGSGNSGATNMTRTLGAGPGLITFIMDVGKPMAAYLISALAFMSVSDKEVYKIICLYACVATVIGHIYPFYLKFKGGKGVASIGGMAIIFVAGMPSCPEAVLTVIIPLSIFVVVVAITKYVSLGSILAVISLFIFHIAYGLSGNLFFAPDSPVLVEWFIILGLMGILIIAKHFTNIKRLLNGTENKLNFKKKEIK